VAGEMKTGLVNCSQRLAILAIKYMMLRLDCSKKKPRGMSAPVAEQTMNTELSYAALPERAHAYCTWTTEIDFDIKRAPFLRIIYLPPDGITSETLCQGTRWKILVHTQDCQV